MSSKSTLGEVSIIGGKPFRTGFISAFWGNFDINDPHTQRSAKRENTMALWDNFYHYTSIAGFKGIIEESGFWASDNRYLNDTEENSNGVGLAREVLQHKSKRSRNLEFVDVLREVDTMLANPRKYGHLVSCFSSVRDDLGQWRGYAAGGVCLRVGRSVDDEGLLFFGPDHLPHEVVYSDCRKRVLLLSVIRRFEHEYVLDRSAMPNHWPDDHDENYAKEIHSLISSDILAFKNQAFASEAEARIVISYQQIAQYDGGLRYRVSPLGIVPYLRTGDHLAVKKDGGRLPLHEVIIGPSQNQDLMAESVEFFLRQSGYSNTLISLSNVPSRML